VSAAVLQASSQSLCCHQQPQGRAVGSSTRCTHSFRALLSCLQLSHNRKTLLKFLLRTIALSSYAPTGNLAATRPQDEDAQLLYASLKVRTHFLLLHHAGLVLGWKSLQTQAREPAVNCQQSF
jgi:hypothetical protein